MDFPATFQDRVTFSAGHASSVDGPSEGTPRVSLPAGYPSLPYYEPNQSFYGKSHTVTSDAHINDPLSMVFEASAQNATEDIGGGQLTYSSAYAPSIHAQNISTNAPAMAAAPPASNVAPLTPAIQVTNQRRFRCPICPNTFDRLSRADACHNNHLGWKPHACQGACGNTACNAAYGSVENLHRHIRPPAERKVACARCRSFLKQNISRHMKSCV